MAQINDGTVQVTTGSPTVTGTDIDWSQVSVNSLFMVVGRPQIYLISAVDTGASTLTLATNYGEASASGAAYTVHRDFTPNYSIPVLNRGDVETASIMARAVAIIDEQIAAAGTATGSYDIGPISQGAHGFLVGSVIKFNGTTYALASSDTDPNSVVVGVVSAVADPNTFTLRPCRGLVSNIDAGFALSPGVLYYLTATAIALNVTSSLGATFYQIPIYLAISATSAVFLGGGGGSYGTVFTGATDVAAGVKGLVPVPLAGDEDKLLGGDGTWKTAANQLDSIQFQHLKATPAFNTVDWDSLTGVMSVKAALINLNDRLANAYSYRPATSVSGRLVYMTPGVYTPVTPAGSVGFFFRAWSSGANRTSANGVSGQNPLLGASGGYCEGTLLVPPGTTLDITVAAAPNWVGGYGTVHDGNATIIRSGGPSGTILLNLIGATQFDSGYLTTTPEADWFHTKGVPDSQVYRTANPYIAGDLYRLGAFPGGGGLLPASGGHRSIGPTPVRAPGGCVIIEYLS